MVDLPGDTSPTSESVDADVSSASRAASVQESAAYKAVLEMFIEGQKENTRAIKSTADTLTRLEITFTQFAAESSHTNKEVDALRKDIHGEGGINDSIIDLKLKDKADSTRRQIIWIALSAAFSFVTAWFIATR